MAQVDTDALDELYHWMLAHKVLSVTIEGITLTLHEAALFALEVPDDDQSKAKAGTWADEYDEETPHQRIRREHAAELTRIENGDSDG